jgi:hypothetical protein
MSQQEQEQTVVSPFDEVKDMDNQKALTILFQASTAAQKAGVLSVRDSVLLAAAIEHFSDSEQ